MTLDEQVDYHDKRTLKQTDGRYAMRYATGVCGEVGAVTSEGVVVKGTD